MSCMECGRDTDSAGMCRFCVSKPTTGGSSIARPKTSDALSISITVDTSQLDEAIAKAERLVNTLERAEQLMERVGTSTQLALTHDLVNDAMNEFNGYAEEARKRIEDGRKQMDEWNPRLIPKR